MWVVDGIVIHWAIVHTTFPFGSLKRSAASHRERLTFVTAPLQEAIAVPIPPRLSVAAIAKPPVMPFCEPRISPFENVFVLIFPIILPNNVRANRGLRPVGTGPGCSVHVWNNAIRRLREEDSARRSGCLRHILDICQKGAEEAVPLANHPTAKSLIPMTTYGREFEAERRHIQCVPEHRVSDCFGSLAEESFDVRPPLCITCSLLIENLVNPSGCKKLFCIVGQLRTTPSHGCFKMRSRALIGHEFQTRRAGQIQIVIVSLSSGVY